MWSLFFTNAHVRYAALGTETFAWGGRQALAHICGLGVGELGGGEGWFPGIGRQVFASRGVSHVRFVIAIPATFGSFFRVSDDCGSFHVNVISASRKLYQSMYVPKYVRSLVDPWYLIILL